MRLFPHLSQIYTSFTMMRFLPVLAFAAMAFAECPAPKQCMDNEFLCSGPYDEKTGCYAMDTCMQMKDSNGCPGKFQFNSLILLFKDQLLHVLNFLR